MTTPKQIIDKLGLRPHPEGGYYKETYRSEGKIEKSSLAEDYSGKRNYSTAIYFMLTSDSFSAFHRIKQDEFWHFYVGSPLIIHMISKEGEYSAITLGNDLVADEIPQFVVKGGDWFAAEVVNKDSYSLVGCTVSPGFDFDDFELPKKAELLEKFPKHEAIINRLSR